MFESLQSTFQRLLNFYDGRTPALRRWLTATLTTLLIGPVAYMAFLKLTGPVGPVNESGVIAPVQVPADHSGELQQPGSDPGEDAFPEITFNRLGVETPHIPTGRSAASEVEQQREAQAIQRKTEMAVARSRILSLQADADELQRLQEQLLNEQQRWHEHYETLWTDKRGQRIGASDSLATEVIQILTNDFPSKSKLEKQQAMLSELKSPIQDILNSPSPNVAAVESLRPRLGEVEAEIKQMLQSFRTSMESLDRIISDTAMTPVGERTLEKVQSEREQAIATEIRIRQDKEQAEIDKAREDAERMEEERKRLACLARLKLQQDFEQEYPNIQARLVAFTSEGMKLRGNAAGPGPVSFSLMQGKGALKRDENGRQQIAIVVGESRRESGGLMKFQGGQNEQQARDFDEVQQFLSKYGLLMVEKKLLAP